jgi:CRISPR/Cas system Type II protein with McrA/HNH and RuvC-like nuclease domain
MPRKPGRNKRAEAQNVRLFKRDGWKCVYCGWDGNSADRFVYLELDHLDPTLKTLDDFDPEFDDNKVTSCAYCNKKKGQYVPQGGSRAEKLEDAIKHVKSLRAAIDDWFKGNYLP